MYSEDCLVHPSLSGYPFDRYHDQVTLDNPIQHAENRNPLSLLLTSTDITMRLPTEVLCIIFDEYVPTLDVRQPYAIPALFRAPLLLTFVCHRWREIALSTPTFWNRCNLGFPIHAELMRLFLQRAGDESSQTHHCVLGAEWNTATSDDKVANRIRVIVENLDKFKTLDLPLTYDYGISRHFTQYGGMLPGIHSTGLKDRVAKNLTDLRIRISGAHAIYNNQKLLWSRSIVTSAPQLHSLDLSVPSLGDMELECWSLGGIQHLSLDVIDNGLPLSLIISTMSMLPQLVTFKSGLANDPQIGSVIPTPFVISQPLNLPNLRSIELVGTYVVETLCILYGLIQSAPKLDHLIVNSYTGWTTANFMRLLDLLPCALTALVIDVLFPEYGSGYTLAIEQYIRHSKVGPTLRKLALRNKILESGAWLNDWHAYRRSTEVEEFLHSLRLTPSGYTLSYDCHQDPSGDFLACLEEVEAFECLPLFGDILSHIIESKISKGDKPLSLRIRTSPLHTPPRRYVKDWQVLYAVNRMRPGLLKCFQWENCDDGGRVTVIDYRAASASGGNDRGFFHRQIVPQASVYRLQ